MSDVRTNQKQQFLLRYIFQALNKAAIELPSYEMYTQPPQKLLDAGHPLEDTSASSSFNNSIEKMPADIDAEAIVDTNELKRVLTERISSFEERFLPKDLHISNYQLSLLKHSILLLQYIQMILKQCKHIHPALSRWSQKLSGSRPGEEKHDSFSFTARQSRDMKSFIQHSIWMT